ncbi:MAG: 50S ribosomal protein L25/general stress protein Ctc [Alphaproteobacteria bacterium]
MVDTAILNAVARSRAGKGAARAERRAGRVPAVIYGGKGAPLPITLDPKTLGIEYAKTGFFAQLFDIDVDGSKHRALCRDVQLDPVSDVLIHADFLRVSAATRINVEVPVTFINEEDCPGLRRGGVLNMVRHAVELNCQADAIPAELVIDLIEADIGDSIHISHIKLPDGVTPTITDRDFTVVTIAAPTIAAEVTEEEGEEGEAVEGEDATEATEDEAES